MPLTCGVVAEVLWDPLPHEDRRPHDRQRQQHVDDAARHVDPEVADPIGVLAGEATDQSHEHREADGRRDEVLDREPEHLGQVAERELAAIGLPVRVADEARCRVERDVGVHSAEALRVERQGPLEPEQQVQNQQAQGAEPQNRAGISAPCLLCSRIGSEEFVDDSLDAAHPLFGEDAIHVRPQQRVWTR